MNNIAVLSRSDIPSLIDRASARLSSARESGEVLEAKAIAEMALHYARVTKAANETHADCLRIITRAEIRMANEVDAAQGRGELRTRADNQHVLGLDKLDDLGLDRRRIAEWREVRDAGEVVVEAALSEALIDGRAPTKADIRNHVRGTFGTGDNEWYTPPEYLDAARDVLGSIDLDPASSAEAQRTVQAAAYYTKDNDGLNNKWAGRIWLNPPYAQPHIANFVAKMVAERRAGSVSAGIMLTHNYTDTAWFHEAASIADAICFTRGRVKFYDPDGNTAAPTQGQAFFYFGDDAEGFAVRFKDIGFVVFPYIGVGDE